MKESKTHIAVWKKQVWEGLYCVFQIIWLPEMVNYRDNKLDRWFIIDSYTLEV